MDYKILVRIETALKDEPAINSWYDHFIATYIVIPTDINITDFTPSTAIVRGMEYTNSQKHRL